MPKIPLHSFIEEKFGISKITSEEDLNKIIQALESIEDQDKEIDFPIEEILQKAKQ